VTDFYIQESANEYGIAREIRTEGDESVVTKLTYDAEPMLKAAEILRTETAGQSWGNGRFVGIIPYAELNRINAEYQGAEERKHQILSWLRDNPKLVTFDKFLK